MTDPHLYTAKEVWHIREIAFNMAQKSYRIHLPEADDMGQEYRITLLQYAESLAQSYILAGVSPDAMNETYLEMKDS